MDVEMALRELYQEKHRLDEIIAQLESMQRTGMHEVASPRKHAGRKFMTPEERLAVSRRMTMYWAERKAATA